MIVVYSCTRSWYHYLAVSLYSLLKTNQVDKIYLFIEDDIYPNLDKFQNNFFCKIEIINYNKIKKEYFTNSDNYNFTKSALIRLILSKIIKEDKVLYIDTDAIVVDDISDLWNIDIDNYYLAGVQDIGMNNYLDYISLQDLPEKYINSGILLMNLKRIRNDKIDDRWLNLLNKKNFRFPDQDVINKVCENNILFIDKKYNSSPTCGFADNMKIIHFSNIKIDWVKELPYSYIWYDLEKEYNKWINIFN